MHKHKKRLSHKKTRKGAMKGGAMSIEKIIEKTELNFDENFIRGELERKYYNAPEKICIGKQMVDAKIEKYKEQKRNFPNKTMETLQKNQREIIEKYKKEGELDKSKIDKSDMKNLKHIYDDMTILSKISNLSRLGDMIIEIGLSITKKKFYDTKDLILLDCARNEMNKRKREEEDVKIGQKEIKLAGWYGVPCAEGKILLEELIKEATFLKEFVSNFDLNKTNREFHTIVTTKLNELKPGDHTQRNILNKLLEIINDNRGKGWLARDVITKFLEDERIRMKDQNDRSIFNLVDRDCISNDELVELVDTIDNLEKIPPYLDNRNTTRPGPENYGDGISPTVPIKAWNPFKLSPGNPVHKEPVAMERKSLKKTLKKSSPKPALPERLYRKEGVVYAEVNKLGSKRNHRPPPPPPNIIDDDDGPEEEEEDPRTKNIRKMEAAFAAAHEQEDEFGSAINVLNKHAAANASGFESSSPKSSPKTRFRTSPSRGLSRKKSGSNKKAPPELLEKARGEKKPVFKLTRVSPPRVPDGPGIELEEDVEIAEDPEWDYDTMKRTRFGGRKKRTKRRS